MGKKTLPVLKPIVCVKSTLSGYRSVGKTVYTVGLRPNGQFNAEYQLAESGEADVKA